MSSIFSTTLKHLVLFHLFFFTVYSNAQNNTKGVVGIWERYYVEGKDSLCESCLKANYKSKSGTFDLREDGSFMYSGIILRSTDSNSVRGKWLLINDNLNLEFYHGARTSILTYKIRFINADMFYEVNPFGKLNDPFWMYNVFKRTTVNTLGKSLYVGLISVNN